MALHRLVRRLRHPRPLKIAAGLAGLAPTRRAAVRNARNVLWFWLLFKSGMADRKPGLAKIDIAYDRQSIGFWVRDFVDLVVAEEIFLDEVYRVDVPHWPRLILDLGSHIGLSVLWFHAHFPGAAIYGFEPDPASFRMLETNTKALPNVTVHNVAVGASERTAEFFRARQSWSSSLVVQGSPDGGIPVQVRSIPALLTDLEARRADLVKLDVEGAEWEILEAAPLDGVADVVIGELHAHGAPGGRPSKGLERLGRFVLEVRKNDDFRCIFVAHRHI